MDPEWYDFEFCNALQRDLMLEMFENATEIACHGENVDKVQITNKLECFNALRDTYNSLGKRLRKLVWIGKSIDWASCGPFSVKEVDVKVIVTCKVFRLFTTAAVSIWLSTPCEQPRMFFFGFVPPHVSICRKHMVFHQR